MNVSWLDYLYSNKKDDLLDVIASFGMPLPNSYEELYECVDYLIETKGHKAEISILKIHPDYDAIKKLVEEEKEVPFHNFSGEIDDAKKDVLDLIEINKLKAENKLLQRNQNILFVLCGFLVYHTILNKK